MDAQDRLTAAPPGTRGIGTDHRSARFLRLAATLLTQHNHPVPADDRRPGLRTWLENGVTGLRDWSIAGSGAVT